MNCEQQLELTKPTFTFDIKPKTDMDYDTDTWSHDEDIRESIETDDADYVPPALERTRASRVTKRKRPTATIRPATTGGPSRNKTGKAPSIPGPLSEITKGSSVPLKDIEAYVNRPAQQRHEERDNKKGHVGRPMNSFMLYRSAFAERTKEWCQGSKHQVVSAVAGQSWPLESIEIRSQYARWAATDKANHAAAFPSYKYTPNKTANKRNASDAFEVSDDDDESDVEYVPPRQAVRRRLALAHFASPSVPTIRPGPEQALQDVNANANYSWSTPAPAPTSWPMQYATVPVSSYVVSHQFRADSPMAITPSFFNLGEPTQTDVAPVVPAMGSYRFTSSGPIIPYVVSPALRHDSPMAFSNLEGSTSVQQTNVAPVVPAMGSTRLQGLGIYTDGPVASTHASLLTAPLAWVTPQPQEQTLVSPKYVYDPLTPLQRFFEDAMPAIEEDEDEMISLELHPEGQESQMQCIDPALLMQGSGTMSTL